MQYGNSHENVQEDCPAHQGRSARGSLPSEVRLPQPRLGAASARGPCLGGGQGKCCCPVRCFLRASLCANFVSNSSLQVLQNSLRRLPVWLATWVSHAKALISGERQGEELRLCEDKGFVFVSALCSNELTLGAFSWNYQDVISPAFYRFSCDFVAQLQPNCGAKEYYFLSRA